MLDEIAQAEATFKAGTLELRNEIARLTEANSTLAVEIELTRAANARLETELAKTSFERDHYRRFSDQINVQMRNMYNLMLDTYNRSQEIEQEMAEPAKIEHQPEGDAIPTFLKGERRI